MKIRTSTALILMGLLLVVFTAVGLAQTQSSQNQKQTKDASTMDSCCCAAHQKDATSVAKTDGQKSGCCCDESCDMNAENKGMKDHAASSGCCCCDGDSCDMTKMDAKANHSSGHECCCKGDSCDMKEGSQMSQSAGASCCNMKMKHDSMKSEKPKQ